MTVLCGARKSDGTPCRNPGNGQGNRCKWHGGASNPPGPTHPSWKHGRASLLTGRLPERLRAAYDASVNDPEILSLREQIALVDARIVELVERLETGESEELMDLIVTAVSDVSNELSRDDPNLIVAKDHMRRVTSLIRKRRRYESTWTHLARAMEQRRRLVDTERKLAEAKQTAVDAAELRVLVTRILQSIRDNVLPLDGGRRAADAVADDVRRMIGVETHRKIG